MTNLISERRVVSLIIVVLTAGLIQSSFGLEFADLGGAFSPMFFPRIILALLLVLAAIDLCIEMTRHAESQNIRLLPVAILSAGFVVYSLLLVPLGFFISSVLVALLILITLGVRKPLVLLLLPTVSAGSLVLLFNHILKMPLPASPFVWWI
jgi:hypothetical protein